jgi:transcriptional regulator with XRE-family HTH domain
MPATASPLDTADRARLTRLGARLRAARREQSVTMVAAAEVAGMSRVTLHRIERGEPSVAIGAWIAAAGALGLSLDLVSTKAPRTAAKLPARIRLGDYPQLKKLAWQLKGVQDLAPREALDLYERNWRHVDPAALTPRETELIDALTQRFGGGRLLV